MTPERLAEWRRLAEAASPGPWGTWSRDVGANDALWRAITPAEVLWLLDQAAEVDRLRAQVSAYADQCDAWADANDPVAARGGWQASGYMKAYRRVAEDLRAALASGDEHEPGCDLHRPHTGNCSAALASGDKS